MSPTQKPMSLAKLLRDFKNGDETGWDLEREWLEANHPRRLARIRREIEAGDLPPIRLCFAEFRVIDGHHRVVAAWQLGVQRLPVADAWDDSDWVYLASDQGGDDPEAQLCP